MRARSLRVYILGYIPFVWFFNSNQNWRTMMSFLHFYHSTLIVWNTIKKKLAQRHIFYANVFGVILNRIFNFKVIWIFNRISPSMCYSYLFVCVCTFHRSLDGNRNEDFLRKSFWCDSIATFVNHFFFVFCVKVLIVWIMVEKITCVNVIKKKFFVPNIETNLFSCSNQNMESYFFFSYSQFVFQTLVERKKKTTKNFASNWNVSIASSH